jgi:ADP-ribose pyrophosphatase YjhB (NUDIX family)
MSKPKSYIAGDVPSFEHVFLPDSVYEQAIRTLCVYCTDCVFIDRQKGVFYLAMRNIQPMVNWWMIGGRVYAGESELESIHRCVKRETGLDIAVERFEFVTMKRYLFPSRAQFPQDVPSDSVTNIFCLDITPQEIEFASAHLDPSEYDSTKGLRAFSNVEELVQAGVFESITDLYREVFPARTIVDEIRLLRAHFERRCAELVQLLQKRT